MGKTKPPKGKGKKPNAFAPLSPYDVLTLSQAAAYLQLPEEAVRAEAEGGRLNGRAVGDGWRFTRDELFRWAMPRPSPTPPPAWTPELAAECEREIAAIYAARRELGTVGDHFPDEGGG